METQKIEAEKILKFLHIAENLKKLIRHSWLSDGRRESVAEHSVADKAVYILFTGSERNLTL